MPSRPPPPQPLPTIATITPPHHHHRREFLIGGLIAAAIFLTAAIISLTIFLYRKLSHNRTTPVDQNHRRFSFSILRRASNSFSASTRLGHGGFGSVHKATLPSGETVALKVMDSPGSIQGEREFHNELSLCSNLRSPFILSLLGYSSDRSGRKLVLVYELMSNRSLQDALLDRRCDELMVWSNRFDVVVSVAKGLEYLHHECNPPVIHGDIKPSNVLLDREFRAKIGDFGLARVKCLEDSGMEMMVEEIHHHHHHEKKKKKDDFVVVNEDCSSVSVVEEFESAVSVTNTTAGNDIDRSPESCNVRVLVDSDASPEVAVVSQSSVVSDGCFDKFSIDSGNQRKRGGGGGGGGSGRDWWWKQENNGGGSESGRVKDYVMEWIGSEIKKERPKSSEWVGSGSSICSGGGGGDVVAAQSKVEGKKKQRRKLEWWASLDEEKVKGKKNRKPREWWKEEFCEELSKKSRKKKRSLDCRGNGGESWWQRDEDVGGTAVEKKKKRKSKSSRGSIDWWLDGLSGELRTNGRRNSQDWGNGDIPKSGGISSTPSMRGTVCYIAPEYGGGGQLSEKCDVYSFGVLLLVLVAGRRPLQVTASPISEFERANLISWARQLAHNGKLLDLVDSSIHSLDKEQALLCITIALLCLQRSPGKRPSMKEIVGMLSGEADPPHLPFEFSPSPPSNFPFKSRKKAR